MKKILFISGLLTAFVVIMTGCEKDNAPAAKTKTELISQSSWKFSSATAGGSDISNNAAISCIKDDVVTFTAAGGGTITDGSVVCNPTTAGNFTWNFQNSETKVMMSAGVFPGSAGVFTLVSLSETTLVVSQDMMIPPSMTPVTVVATYTH